MSFKVEVTSSVDIPKDLAKIDNAEFWKFAHTEWNKLIFPYVPFDTGTLAESVNISSDCIEYRAPYASTVYNQNRNFRTDKHELASSRWDEAAAPTQSPKLIEALQAYVDSGRLKL